MRPPAGITDGAVPLYWSTAKVWQPSHRSALESSFLDAEMREKNDQAMATRAKIGKASLRKKELCCDSSARVQSLMPLLQIQRRCQRAQHALGNASVTVGHGWGMSRDTLGRRRNNREQQRHVLGGRGHNDTLLERFAEGVFTGC